MSSRILVVDDEPHIRDVITFALERAGMVVTSARDGAEALIAWRRHAPDLIVLDISMPERDGLDVCRTIRKTSEVPILFLSARDEEVDRIIGLEIGGDDYVSKPFSPRELLARVKAILKRAGDDSSAPSDLLVKGALRLDRQAHSVTWRASPVTLTPLEFAVLSTLLARPDMVFSREQLIVSAYGPSMHVSDRTIDSHVRNIRAKFLAAGCSNVIATVHGVGFRLGAIEASA
ncbi:two-component system, OmpR family, response regulator [Devosia enhydra]|uniref:Two-component system, OmpR family, response regulator n=1 Tax=Devosia enhydra TaxID=665118 RepID=A0A1K2HTH9_9HYPH|nr:response regulator transcription factor [Devosia enhydra]SFZ81434.1 two-component system, OmpR family, response regulator [Devosia enhydra]